MMDLLSKLIGKTVNTPSEVIIQGFTSGSAGAMPGTLIKTDTVYSISEGRVLSIDTDYNDLKLITVLYQPGKLFRYCLLTGVDVEVDEHIIPTTKIGVTDKGQLRFEYCTLQESPFPVRVNGTEYYKHDGTAILCGNRQLYMSDTALYKYMQKVEPVPVQQPKFTSNLSNIISGV